MTLVTDDDLPGAWTVSVVDGDAHFANDEHDLEASFDDSGSFVVRQRVAIDDVDTQFPLDSAQLSGIDEVPGFLADFDVSQRYVPLTTRDTDVDGMVDVVCTTLDAVSTGGNASPLDEGVVSDLVSYAYGNKTEEAVASHDEIQSVDESRGGLETLEIHVFPVPVLGSTGNNHDP